MNKPVVLANTARAVMDAWADKIVSGKALPDHIVGRLDTGGGLVEREFIFEVYEKVPIFAVMQNGKNIRSASSDEYTEVENAIASGRFHISEFVPSYGASVVIHECTGQPLAPKRPEQENGLSF
jgi:hypothetical protein